MRCLARGISGILQRFRGAAKPDTPAGPPSPVAQASGVPYRKRPACQASGQRGAEECRSCSRRNFSHFATRLQRKRVPTTSPRPSAESSRRDFPDEMQRLVRLISGVLQRFREAAEPGTPDGMPGQRQFREGMRLLRAPGFFTFCNGLPEEARPWRTPEHPARRAAGGVSGRNVAFCVFRSPRDETPSFVTDCWAKLLFRAVGDRPGGHDLALTRGPEHRERSPVSVDPNARRPADTPAVRNAVSLHSAFPNRSLGTREIKNAMEDFAGSEWWDRRSARMRDMVARHFLPARGISRCKPLAGSRLRRRSSFYWYFEVFLTRLLVPRDSSPPACLSRSEETDTTEQGKKRRD